MAAWEITKLWTSKEIGEYRAYVTAQRTPRVGRQRCTCEDLSLRVVTDFAAANGLPVAIANNARRPHSYHPPGAGAGSYSMSHTLAFRHGITPEDFKTKAEFDTEALTTTGASDLISHKITKFVSGAVEGKAESLALAKEGDIIVLGNGGSHVQVVTSVGSGLVNIMQGNFRPKDERATTWEQITGTNQNDPNDSKYIGAIVADEKYARDAKGVWHYKGQPANFKADKGRVMIWDFDAWNALIVQHTVQSGETLSAIALKRWGNGNAWKRIYETNQTKIGANPDKVRSGMKLFVWK